MTTPGQGQVWTGEQLAARLIAQRGVAPEVVHYAVYWAVTCLGSADLDGYLVPGEAECLAPASFDFWLAQRGLAGAERLAVVVLVIRAELTPDREIDTCALEYRRGSMDGPYCGSPARITFSGAARNVRFYQAAPDGNLSEIAPTPSLQVPLDQASDGDARWGAVTPALGLWFGTTVNVLGTRAPTVIEAMVGIGRVLYLQCPGRAETTCGVLWHGSIATVLPAAFPHFDIGARLTPAQHRTLAAVAAADQLVICEARQDDEGLAVLARRRTTLEHVLVRFDAEVPRIVPYVPGLPMGILEAQAQWVRYIETYEHLRARDAYRDGVTGALIVLTQGGDGKAWRHSIDEDGVETWRTAETGATDLRPPDQSMALSEPRERPAAETEVLESVAAPFGHLVDRRFPGAAYDIEEATRCLKLGRPTAAVFHATRIMKHGLDAYAAWRGEPSPPHRRGEWRWRVLLRWMRDDHAATALHTALDGARAAWRGATLQVATKYTEAEAQRIITRVEHLMRSLAALCDEDGVPTGELDDDP